MRDEIADLNEALKHGLKRAGLHWARAGYEVLAGLGALLDELAEAGREDDGDESKPTHIQVD